MSISKMLGYAAAATAATAVAWGAKTLFTAYLEGKFSDTAQPELLRLPAPVQAVNLSDLNDSHDVGDNFTYLWTVREEHGIALQFDPSWISNDREYDYAAYAQPGLADGVYGWCQSPDGDDILLIGAGGHNVVIYDNAATAEVRIFCPHLSNVDPSLIGEQLLDATVDIYRNRDQLYVRTA